MINANNLFKDYKPHILNLDLQAEKKYILDDHLIVNRENNISIYYSAHNEVINTQASIIIIGICPGFQQMYKSFSIVKSLENSNDDDILENCKSESRLFGSSRQNLITMFDQLNINYFLKVNKASEIFDLKFKKLHTTSLIRYPVFIGKELKNYNGYTPSLLKNSFLYRIASNSIQYEIEQLPNLKIIIPLGKAVETFLDEIFRLNTTINRKIIRGFPHPSGLNAHRKKIFDSNKANIINQIKLLYDNQ